MRKPEHILEEYHVLRAQDGQRDALEILRGLKGLCEPRAFAAWATRIVTRRCAKFIDRQVKRRDLRRCHRCRGRRLPYFT